MKRWILAWAGTSVLGDANGGAREVLYADALGDDAAGAVSTATLLARSSRVPPSAVWTV